MLRLLTESVLTQRPRGLTFTWWGCCDSHFWHKPTELAHSFLFYSCVYFCLYGPFNCISFHKFPRWLSAFSLCSSGLISALLVLSPMYLLLKVSFRPNIFPLQWGTADAEIKVPSGENTELKRSPFKAWSRSVYSHTCSAYCQRFLPCLFLPFRSIHLHFFQNLSRFSLCWLCLAHGSCVGPQSKINHPAGCRFPCWVPTECK